MIGQRRITAIEELPHATNRGTLQSSNNKIKPSLLTSHLAPDPYEGLQIMPRFIHHEDGNCNVSQNAGKSLLLY
jgi:hypothetical protein